MFFFMFLCYKKNNLEANKYSIRLDNSVKMVLFKAICRPITKVTILYFLINFHYKCEFQKKN